MDSIIIYSIVAYRPTLRYELNDFYKTYNEKSKKYTCCIYLLYATKIIIINYNNYAMGIDGWVGGVAVVSSVRRMNEVNLRRARLVGLLDL